MPQSPISRLVQPLPVTTVTLCPAAKSTLKTRVSFFLRTFFAALNVKCSLLTQEASCRKDDTEVQVFDGGTKQPPAPRIGPVASELMLCEGPEDRLTRWRFRGASLWVSLGTANLSFVKVLAAVETVVIAVYNNAASYADAEAAAHTFADQSRRGDDAVPLFGLEGLKRRADG